MERGCLGVMWVRVVSWPRRPTAMTDSFGF